MRGLGLAQGVRERLDPLFVASRDVDVGSLAGGSQREGTTDVAGGGEDGDVPVLLGWHLSTASHSSTIVGGGGGFRSELRIYPKLGYAMAVLANETSLSEGELARLVVR